MGEEAIDAILGNRELRVVVVVRVDGNSVGECRETRRQPHIASNHGASGHAAAFGCNTHRAKVAPDDFPGLRRSARKRKTDAVEHRTLA